MTRSLEAYADGEAQTRLRESTAASSANRILRAELRDTQEQLATVRAKLDLHETLDALHTSPPAWKVPAHSTKHHGVICMQVSDVHWAAVIRPEEINFINAYNLKISKQRLHRTFEGGIKLARDYFAGLTYDGLQLFLPGDMHNGEIHDELRSTNAVTMADSVISLAEPLEAGIKMLAEEFGTVRIACVVGNHGRTTKKPVAKHRATDSYDYLTYRVLERDFRKNPKVQITIAAAPDLRVQVYEKFYCLTHGDQFKGGTGIAAELSPLLLGVHRKSRRDAAAGRPFDVMTMGHFHKTLPLFSSGLNVGGAVMGYDEYAFLNNFRPEPPSSPLWVDTPQRGIATFSTTIHCMKRSEEGW